MFSHVLISPVRPGAFVRTFTEVRLMNASIDIRTDEGKVPQSGIDSTWYQGTADVHFKFLV